MAIIPIAEFAPDQPDIPASTSDTIYNVLPLAANSYGPLPSLQPYSAAITARCQGALSVTDNNGNVRIFSGDATHLYRQTSASITPADVSKAANYTTPSTGGWSFTTFGNRIIATNYNDAPQSYVEGTSALFSDLITTGTTSLKAKYVATVRDHIVFGNTTDGTYGTQPQRVWWTAINDPTNVPTPGTQAAANAMSDYQDNLGTHGALTGIASNIGAIDAALFYERAIYRMIYSGMPNIYDMQRVTSARGLICPGGLAVLDSVAYHIAEDGFYAFDGAEPKPIGKFKVDRFFGGDFQSSYPDRVSSAVDPTLGVIAWMYPGAGAVNGVPNRILFYNPYLDRWAATDTGSVNAEWLVKGMTFNSSLEGLDAFGTMETLAYPMDSAAWNGGRSLLGAFDSAHKFGYFNGSSLAATVVTSDFEPLSGRQSMVNRVRPLCDVSSATIAAAARNHITEAVTYGATCSMVTNGSVPVRARGRYHRYKIGIPAGIAWSNISGLDLEEIQAAGGR